MAESMLLRDGPSVPEDLAIPAGCRGSAAPDHVGDHAVTCREGVGTPFPGAWSSLRATTLNAPLEPRRILGRDDRATVESRLRARDGSHVVGPHRRVAIGGGALRTPRSAAMAVETMDAAGHPAKYLSKTSRGMSPRVIPSSVKARSPRTQRRSASRRAAIAPPKTFAQTPACAAIKAARRRSGKPLRRTALQRSSAIPQVSRAMRGMSQRVTPISASSRSLRAESPSLVPT